jgi:hypothetical protein
LTITVFYINLNIDPYTKPQKVMKKLILSATLLLSSAIAFCSVTVHYENRDNKGYNMVVKIDGEYKEVKIESGSSERITIKGGNNACYFVTSCGEIEVYEGDKIVVKDRCISVYRSLQQNYTKWTNY